MTPQDLVGRIVALVPDFGPYWDDPENCFRNDDGSFTLYGVFLEFTNFFRERSETLPILGIAAIGAFVSECMGSTDADLDNAAGTCFVENIAGEPFARELSQYFTGQALDYYRAWGGRI